MIYIEMIYVKKNLAPYRPENEDHHPKQAFKPRDYMAFREL